MKKRIFLIIPIILFFSASLFAQQLFQHLMGVNAIPRFTWLGTTGDGKWSTANNWSGNAVPGNSDVAHFIAGVCLTNCNVNMDVTVNVAGVDIQTAFGGTITQPTGIGITIGASGWTQAGGTFVGGDSNITINGIFTVSAGSFTSTTATLKTLSNITWANSAFTANGGTILITSVSWATRTLSFGTNTVQNLTYQAGAGFDGYVMNITGTLTVLGTFLVQDVSVGALTTFSGGTFNLKGDVTNTAAFSKITLRSIFIVSGSGNQSITGSVNSGLSNLELASTGGTVTFSSDFFNPGDFKYTSGTIVMPTNFVKTGFFNSTFAFNPGALTFTNLEVRQDCTLDGYIMNTTGTIVVNGNLSFTRPGCTADSNMNGGMFSVKGNLSSSTFFEGTTSTLVSGSTNQTISGSGTSGFINGLEIASTGGTVTISGTPTFRNKFTYTSGTVDATGSTVNISTWYNTTYIFTLGSIVFDNVTFNSAAYADGIIYNLSGGTMTVAGNLTFAHISGSIQNTINNGTITVAKNLTTTGTLGFKGNAQIQLTGTGGSSISVGMLLPSTTLTSAKTSATSTLAAAWNISGAGQSLSITSGTMNLAGYNLTVNSTLTVASGAKLVCNGGTATAAIYVLNGEVYCPTSVGTTWTGLAGNNLWNDAGNWSNNAIPGSTDVAIFNSVCTGANCNVTINTSITVKGIRIQSGYTGTITQSSGVTMTVGSTGWSQAAGTFQGGDSAITLNGPWALSAGTFTATSGVLTVAKDMTLSGTGVFNANSGSVIFDASTNGVQNLSAGASNFNNVSFSGPNSIAVITGTVTVLGTLTLNDTVGGAINTGTVAAKGNIVAANLGKKGTGLVKIAGSTSQTVTGITGAYIPNMEIASTGGTVGFSGNVEVHWNYTYTSGTVNFGTSTLIFDPNFNETSTVTPGTISYGNVTFSGYNTVTTLVGTMSVYGQLEFHDGQPTAAPGAVSGGTIEAYGDIINTGTGKIGTTLLKVKGSSNQSVTGISNAYFPKIEIASTGGTVSLFGPIMLQGNYTYTSGTVNAGTSTLILNVPYNWFTTVVPGNVNYANVTFTGAGGSLSLSSGTMTVLGALTFSDGHATQGSVNTGTIQAKGDVVFSSYGKFGSALLKISGSADQNLSGVSTAKILDIEFLSTGGTVNLSGTLLAQYNWKWSSGALNAGTSTVNFYGQVSGASYTITPGTVAYNNVDLTSNANNYTIAGTMTVNGNLTLNSGSAASANVNTGTFEVYGDVNYDTFGYQGTAAIKMKGATSANLGLTSQGKRTSGLFTIDKSGGAQVSMVTDQIFQDAGSNFTLLNGTLNVSGYVFSVTSTLTVSAGTTLNCNGGRVSYGSVVNNGTVNCPGFSTYAYNWTGSAGDGKWSTAGNWQGGVVPSTNDYPYFDSANCGANCNVSIDGAVTVKGVKVISGYTGTLTQSAGNVLTVGKRGWTQAGGTFVGAAATNMEITGPVTISNGTFTAPGGVLTLGKALPEYGSATGDATIITLGASATFNHSNGTVSFERGLMTGCCVTATQTIDVPANTNFNNVQVYNTVGGATDVINFKTLNAVNVLGDFTQGNSVVGDKLAAVQGTWNIKGNLKIGASANSGDLDALVLNGTGNQTYSYETGGWAAGVKINKTSGTFAAAGGTTDLQLTNLNLNAGTFTPPSGNLIFVGLNNASLTAVRVAAGTSFTALANFVFKYSQTGTGLPTTVVTIDAPSGFVMQSLDAKHYADNGYKFRLLNLNPVTVMGNMSVGNTPGYLNSIFYYTGTWNVKGNFNLGAMTASDGAVLTLNGTTAQTFTQTGSSTSSLTVANLAGVTLTTALSYPSASDVVAVTSGSLNMAGFAAIMKTLNLSAGTSVYRNGGVLTVNGTVIGLGAYSGGSIAN